MFADTEAFPPWMIWTSMVLAAGAIILFLLGGRRTKPPEPAPLPLVPPPSDELPPPPPLPVAAAPLPPMDRGTERRVGYRRIGNPVEVLVCDEAFQTQPVRGWVVDRSRRGVRLSLNVKHANGTTLQLRPVAAPEAAPWLAIEVRNAQPNEQHWELGCLFKSEPPWDVLLLFG